MIHVHTFGGYQKPRATLTTCESQLLLRSKGAVVWLSSPSSYISSGFSTRHILPAEERCNQKFTRHQSHGLTVKPNPGHIPKHPVPALDPVLVLDIRWAVLEACSAADFHGTTPAAHSVTATLCTALGKTTSLHAGLTFHYVSTAHGGKLLQVHQPPLWLQIGLKTFI